MGWKGRFWRRVWEKATSPKIDEAALQRRLEEARSSLPVPVFWLLGKAQSGKTSLVRALTGSSRAEIGNGFRPCTRSAHLYSFPSEEDCFLRFLDTRGLGDVDYDPAEEIRQLEDQAHLLIVVVKAMDHAQQGVTSALRSILKTHPDWPVIVLETSLHEGYPTPQTRHVLPYPFEEPPYPAAVPYDLARSLAAQREWFAGRRVRFVPVDFTLPEDGYEPELYGLEALWSAIEEALPMGLWAMLKGSPEARRPLRDEHARAARPHVICYSLAAGGAGAVPLPVVDVPLVLAIQAKLFHTIASIYGQPINVQRMAEISSALGIGFVGRQGVRGLTKLIPVPGLGSSVAGLYAAASTFALGGALCEYFGRVLAGDVPDRKILRELYAEEFKKGERWIREQMDRLGAGGAVAMKRLKTWWLLVLTLFLLPYVLLSLAGAVWLVERRLLFHWLAAGGILTLLGWGLARWLRAKKPPPVGPAVKPALTWPPKGHAAWDDVESIARRAEKEDLPLDRPERFGELLIEVLEAVARHYHPKASHPALEIPAPYVLRVVELVACDLRKAFSEYLPWSHVLTLGDFVRLKRLTAWAKELFFLYRIARLGFDPVAALLREIRQMASGQLQDTSAASIKRWAVGFCVRKAGYYAIQLYGGHLVLDEVAFDAYRTPQSKRDAQSAEETRGQIEQEPLRILVCGQVKSGKSSLINVLFGEVRAAVDIVPRTRCIEPFVLDRDGIPHALILDSAGYEGVESDRSPFAELRDAMVQSDLIILVCSARSAARAADRRLIDELNGFFQERPDRMPPPLVVALSHVDQVRPLAEWAPPYDLAEPTGAKARQILDAVRAVGEDLALGAEKPVVPVCLKPEQVYNVEEGLAPVILQMASEAERVKLVRSLRNFHDEEQWRRLWRQAVNSGRVLFQAGTAWARRTDQ